MAHKRRPKNRWHQTRTILSVPLYGGQTDENGFETWSDMFEKVEFCLYPISNDSIICNTYYRQIGDVWEPENLSDNSSKDDSKSEQKLQFVNAEPTKLRDAESEFTQW